MSLVSIAFILSIVLLFVQVLVTGEFLKHLVRDNKSNFDETWSGSERAWNYLYPARIGWLYALSGTFELWGLSECGRSARSNAPSGFDIVGYCAARDTCCLPIRVCLMANQIRL